MKKITILITFVMTCLAQAPVAESDGFSDPTATVKVIKTWTKHTKTRPGSCMSIQDNKYWREAQEFTEVTWALTVNHKLTYLVFKLDSNDDFWTLSNVRGELISKWDDLARAKEEAEHYSIWRF